MADVILRAAGSQAVTRVSNVFIDYYMSEANGEYVKVYLYLLRCLGDDRMEFSVAKMADALDNTQRDISRALAHWEKKGLLSLEFADDGSLAGICVAEPVAPPAQEEKLPPVMMSLPSQGIVLGEAEGQSVDKVVSIDAARATAKRGYSDGLFAKNAANPSDVSYAMGAMTASSYGADSMAASPYGTDAMNVSSYGANSMAASSYGEAEGVNEPLFGVGEAANAPAYGGNAVGGASDRHTYSPDEIAVLGENEDVREMLCLTERYLGRPLSTTELDTVLYWYDGMGLSVDVIVYLVEYCLDRGHKSIHYMNKVALAWAKKGVTTVEEAKGESSAFASRMSVVAVEFGITDRALAPMEREYLDRWEKSYGFSEELMGEACRRTIVKVGRPSFQYADGILKSWKEAGAFTLEAIEKLDEDHKQSAKASASKTRGTQGTKRADRFHNFDEHGYDYGAIQNLLIQQQ